MKVYIAGSSEEREVAIVRALQDMVRASGHEVVSSWTECEGLKRDHPPAVKRGFARTDVDGVQRCDVFWLVAPASKSEGAFLELGIAIDRKTRAIVSGPHARRPDRLFCLLCEIYDSHEDALLAILGKSKGTIG